jgi:hypothetical protein
MLRYLGVDGHNYWLSSALLKCYFVKGRIYVNSVSGKIDEMFGRPGEYLIACLTSQLRQESKQGWFPWNIVKNDFS